MSTVMLLLCGQLLSLSAIAADWEPVGRSQRHDQSAELYYEARTFERKADGRRFEADLAFFRSPTYKLEIVDLGAETQPAYASLAAAFQAHGCVAGVNGGFFHSDWRPAGLVIASGERGNRFETAKLLSGVVYSDGSGIHIVRRSALKDHPGIDALLQTGPYLIEHGRPVRGLSSANASARTFIATDWRGRWVIGATRSAITLADLAQALGTAGVMTEWTSDRAINLDGGSSTGFFFARAEGQPEVERQPRKRVRNLLGIAPR